MKVDGERFIAVKVSVTEQLKCIAYNCVDCGANAEIYDDNGAPFCLLCLIVRDRKSRMQNAAIGDRAQSAQAEYNQALKDLRAAHKRLED